MSCSPDKEVAPGRKERTWYFAREVGSGIHSHAVVLKSDVIRFCRRACRQLLLLAGTTLMRNSVLLVRATSQAKDISSYDGLVEACKTSDRLHASASRLTRGRPLAVPLISWAVLLSEPTEKPSWEAFVDFCDCRSIILNGCYLLLFLEL